MAVALALVAVVTTRAGTGSSLAATQQTGGRPIVPSHLVLLSAGIEQEATPGAVARVFFRMTLAGRPPCGPNQPSSIYSFLIDRDRSTATGVVLHAAPDLGVDITLEIGCDPAAGRMVSEFDPVTIRDVPTPAGAVVLELAAPTRAFRRADLRWIALVREERRYTRLPESGHATWQSVDAWKN